MSTVGPRRRPSTIELNGQFGRKGIRLPTRRGPLQVTAELVDEAQGGAVIGSGELVGEFDPDER